MLIKHLGDKNGWSSISTYRIKHYCRPFVGDTQFGSFVRISMLDNVGSEVGKISNDGIFQHFQLSCDKHKGKDQT